MIRKALILAMVACCGLILGVVIAFNFLTGNILLALCGVALCILLCVLGWALGAHEEDR